MQSITDVGYMDFSIILCTPHVPLWLLDHYDCDMGTPWPKSRGDANENA